MNLRLLSSLHSGLSSRLSPNRLSQMLAPKELEELGLYPRELDLLSSLGPGKRAAELYGPAKTPRRRRPAYPAPAAPAGALRLSPAAISPAGQP